MTQVKKGAVIPKAENEKTQPIVKIEDVLKENEQLKKQLADQAKTNKPEKLEDLLKFYKERNRKINELSSFKSKQEELKSIENKILKSIKSGDFEEVPNTHFSIYAPRGEYEHVKEVLKIANYDVLKDVLKFVNTIITNKVQSLEEEIKA